MSMLMMRSWIYSLEQRAEQTWKLWLYKNLIPEEYDYWGKLIGSWDIDYVEGRGTAKGKHVHGEWHFSRVLEGLGIQDIFICPAPEERTDSAKGEYGERSKDSFQWQNETLQKGGTKKIWCEVFGTRMSGQKKLADILYSGDGVPQTISDSFSDEEDDEAFEESIKWYKQAAERGSAEAYFSLGCAYDYLGAPEEDLKKSFKCFAVAAQMGYSQALVCLGSAYFHGKGAEKDWIKAREMYKKGANMDNIGAKRELANCYKRGIGGEKEYQTALALYLDAAKAHDNYALYELGDMYLKGLGVETDLQKAYDYFMLAVKYGSRAAENALSSKKFRDFKK